MNIDRNRLIQFDRSSAPTRLVLVLLATLVLVVACSRVTILYNTAGLFAKQYVGDYLGLAGDQLERWDPRLEAELARHRAEELPYLAAFFDQTLESSRLGFDRRNMACLIAAFRDLYRRHARLAVRLAAPLLADLTPGQIDALERRFRRQLEEDLADLAARDSVWEKRKRARRYVEAIEDWTGPLTVRQRVIVADITDPMPDTEQAVIQYRSRKRDALIARLREGASEARIEAFMTAWLVDFSDLPPELEGASEVIAERIGELFIRLSRSFDVAQRDRFDDRLRRLRDDLLRLQKQPRLAPLSC